MLHICLFTGLLLISRLRLYLAMAYFIFGICDSRYSLICVLLISWTFICGSLKCIVELNGEWNSIVDVNRAINFL